MHYDDIILLIAYLSIILLLVKPLGAYIARVYQGQSCGLSYVLSPIEHFIYRCCAIHPEEGMDWKVYARHVLIFNLVGMLALYLLLRLQFYLPLNPQQFVGVSPDLAFNMAASFVTNTDWQPYSGENTLSYFSQMVGLTVQNFLSAATGLAVLMAFIRGLFRQNGEDLGNFWVDIVRGVLYILLPLSILLAIFLSSQGVIQNFLPYQVMTPLQSSSAEQLIPMGPVASQVAIKQLGTNGGGFFNVNAAHPFENPTPLTNFIEMLAILAIPAALCYTFGTMIKDKRQGWVILIAMFVLFIPLACMGIIEEQQGNSLLLANTHVIPGGNMEGKELRFGIGSSALWAAATTATSNGSVNAMLDSFTPLGGLVPLWLMHLGEFVFGGVGSGLYGMLVLVIMTVFIAGLMVGRTPEYLGKKIEPYEIKMASVAILLMPLVVIFLTGLSILLPIGIGAMSNPGAHGLTQVLYAFSSMAGNNGSAFAGLNANNAFYNIVGGLEMLMLRYWIILPTLALAGALVKKRAAPVSLGTMPTHTFIFIFLLISVVCIVGALTFFPTLSLGPIVEHLMLGGLYAR